MSVKFSGNKKIQKQKEEETQAQVKEKTGFFDNLTDKQRAKYGPLVGVSPFIGFFLLAMYVTIADPSLLIGICLALFGCTLIVIGWVLYEKICPPDYCERREEQENREKPPS